MVPGAGNRLGNRLGNIMTSSWGGACHHSINLLSEGVEEHDHAYPHVLWGNLYNTMNETRSELKKKVTYRSHPLGIVKCGFIKSEILLYHFKPCDSGVMSPAVGDTGKLAF